MVLLANAMLRASGTLVFIFVGRVNGPEDAGAFALALGYLAILTTLFLGMDDLLIREVTANPQYTAKLVWAYFVLRVSFAFVAYGIVVGWSQIATQATPGQFVAMRLLLASALLDGFGGLGQAVLFAFGEFKYLLYSALVVMLLRLGLGSLLLMALGFVWLALAWPISSFMAAVIVLAGASRIARETGVSLMPPMIEWSLVRHLAGLVPGFAAVSLLSALEYQLDVILLSIMKSTAEVAVYAAAVSVINIIALIPQAYRVVLFPDLVRLRNTAPGALRTYIVSLVRNMAILAVIIALGTTLIAPQLVMSVFGKKFLEARPVLNILIWNIVLLFINVPLVRYLLAEGGQNRIAMILLISTAVNLSANLLLIPSLGAAGSAWSRIISSTVFALLTGGVVLRQLQRTRGLEVIEVKERR